MISSFNVPTLTPHLLPLSKGRGERSLHSLADDKPRLPAGLGTQVLTGIVLLLVPTVVIYEWISAGDEAERERRGKGEHGKEEHLKRGHSEPC
jgi:hypothetical protein